MVKQVTTYQLIMITTVVIVVILPQQVRDVYLAYPLQMKT